MRQITNAFVTLVGRGHHVRNLADAIIIRPASKMGPDFAINVSIGLKVPHASDVDQEAMATQHQLKRNVDHANAMATATKHWAYVIFKRVNVSANITLKEPTVPNAVKITMGIP